VPRTLSEFLLEAHRALIPPQQPAESAPESVLRGTKAAEFATALFSALSRDGAALERARLLFPFFHLLLPPFCGSRADIPRRLRGDWDRLQNGELVADGENAAPWRAVVASARAVFGPGPEQHLLPYPCIQVTARRGQPVRLTCLNGCAGLETALTPELAPFVTTGAREGQPGPGDNVLLLGHFDPHGLAMMAATYLHLRTSGVGNIHPLCGYNETGDYGKLWKRTLPKLVETEAGFTHAVLVDVTVYSRNHNRTLQAIRKCAVANTRVLIVDHHLDTLACLEEMLEAGAEVVLADVPGCFYGDFVAQANLPYCLLGAVGDRDVPLRHWLRDDGGTSFSAAVRSAHDDLSDLMWEVSPPPRQMRKLEVFPVKELLAAAERGFSRFCSAVSTFRRRGYAVPPQPGTPRADSPETAQALGQHWMPPPAAGSHEAAADLPLSALGGVLLVTAQLPTPGRGWYETLEVLLERNPETHYALAGRYLPGSGFNFLCVKNWRRVADPAPLAFVPAAQRARTVGHYGAFWFNLGDAVPTEDGLTAFIQRVNRYFGVKGGRVRAEVRRTLLELVSTRRAEQGSSEARHSD